MVGLDHASMPAVKSRVKRVKLRVTLIGFWQLYRVWDRSSHGKKWLKNLSVNGVCVRGAFRSPGVPAQGGTQGGLNNMTGQTCKRFVIIDPTPMLL